MDDDEDKSDELAEVERQKRINSFEAESGEKWTPEVEREIFTPKPGGRPADRRGRTRKPCLLILSAPFERADGYLHDKRVRIAHRLHSQRHASGGYVPPNYPALAEVRKPATRDEALKRWARLRYGGRPVPSRDEMLKDLKDDYGYIRLSVNEKDLRKLRQALASEEQKRGGRPYHK
jgi:hypothetical protein